MKKEQAIELGYEYCGYRDKDEQRLIKLSELTESDFDAVSEETGPIVLATLGGYKFKVTADEICELVLDMLGSQDTVADEDCELCDLASEADYEPLAKDINARLAKKTYFDMTDIEVTLLPLTRPARLAGVKIMKEILHKLFSGVAFRNGKYPDNGNRYKVKVNSLGQKFIVQADDWFDANERTSPHLIDAVKNGIIYVNHIYHPFSPLTINLSDLIFDN